MANVTGLIAKHNLVAGQLVKSRWTQEVFTADAEDAAAYNLIVGKMYKLIICQEDYKSDKGKEWKKGDWMIVEAIVR